MNARRFPRTLAEAFGPYTNSVIHEPPKAVFESWLRWRQENAKPETPESYHAAEAAEHNSMEIPR